MWLACEGAQPMPPSAPLGHLWGPQPREDGAEARSSPAAGGHFSKKEHSTASDRASTCGDRLRSLTGAVVCSHPSPPAAHKGMPGALLWSWPQKHAPSLSLLFSHLLSKHNLNVARGVPDASCAVHPFGLKFAGLMGRLFRGCHISLP